jgi:mRNA-degrading endonuclease toxin of MazEF toxin-antitoxin module
MLKQGDIIVVSYPLSNKPEKSIIRPVIIVSNEISNNLDKNVLVCHKLPPSYATTVYRFQ